MVLQSFSGEAFLAQSSPFKCRVSCQGSSVLTFLQSFRGDAFLAQSRAALAPGTTMSVKVGSGTATSR